MAETKRPRSDDAAVREAVQGGVAPDDVVQGGVAPAGAVRRVDDPWEIAGLFEEAGAGEDAYASVVWFANLAAHGVDAGDRVHVDIVTAPGGRLCLFPTRSRSDRLGPFRSTLIHGLSGIYSCRYAPVGLDALPAADAQATVLAWMRSIRQRNETPARLRFDAMAGGTTAFAALDRGLRQAGFWVERFAHFGNWYLPVAGLDTARYWADRPAALRNTVRRKEKALYRAYRVELEVIGDPTAAGRAVAAYEQVHQASWKPPEPYPGFIGGLIRSGLAAGMVRLGLLWLDGEPAAAQLWLIAGRKATIFKLSYDERHKHRSVGSILTRHMMAEALAGGGIDEVDFGRGDDPYKADWLPLRRQRWGLAAYNPARVDGLAGALRHLGPRAAKRLLRPGAGGGG